MSLPIILVCRGVSLINRQETLVSKFKHTLVCYLWYLTYRVFFKIYISYKRFLIDMTMNMVSIAIIYLYCKKILLKPKFLTCIVFEIHHKKILNRTSVQLLLCMICMHLLPVWHQFNCNDMGRNKALVHWTMCKCP